MWHNCLQKRGNEYVTNVTHDGNFAICIDSAGGGNFFYQDLQHIPDPGNKVYFTQPMVNIGDHIWPYIPTY
ncbi:hypothetical protein EFN57_09805 [Leuconostoc citreum]|nr:hypothetical protein [Leuconostoc citreum]MCT3063230.1 hypothetical protein [Leuconostoc citreum]